MPGLEELGFSAYHQIPLRVNERVDVEAEFPDNSIIGDKIETLSVNKLLTGSIRVDTTISGNYVAGVSGWQIDGAGNAYFNTITLTGGTIKYGKTSFSDSTNAGYYLGVEGAYFGAAADATKLKYTISSGLFDFIGTISSRSTATLAASINASGQLVNDIVNARLDSSAKTMLSDFSFGATDYAGALKSGTITWNTTTGAITGGSGVLVYRGGIIAANAGTATITLDATTGNATFAGALSAPTGTIGGFTLAASTISATNLVLTSGVANTANITVGTGSTAGGLNSAASASDIVFWAGSTFANRASAPFQVVADGSLVGPNAGIIIPSCLTNAGAVTQSAVMTNGGRYILVATATGWGVRDAGTAGSPFNSAYSSTIVATISPLVNCRYVDNGTEYVLAFASPGTTPYRYSYDGTGEQVITVSGTGIDTRVYHMAWDKTNGYFYFHDGAASTSTSVKRYTISGTTITYVDTITLGSAPGNSGAKGAYIGANYFVIDDDVSGNTNRFKRYDKSTGNFVDTFTITPPNNPSNRIITHPSTGISYLWVPNNPSANYAWEFWRVVLDTI
jgi:hypothetical protein